MHLETKFKMVNNSSEVDLNELRKDLITWAQNQATGKRVQANIGKTKHNYDRMIAKAESYDHMVEFLRSLKFET